MLRQKFPLQRQAFLLPARTHVVVHRWMYLVESKSALRYKRVVRQSNANQCDAAWPCAQAINLSSVALGKAAIAAAIYGHKSAPSMPMFFRGKGAGPYYWDL
jgi:hypothetical protein